MRDFLRFLRAHWLLLALGLLALKAFDTAAHRTVRELRSGSEVSTLFGWDTSFYYFWLRSAALDFDVDFTNDILLSNTLPEEEKRFALDHLPRTDLGLPPNKYPIGWALFHLPWFTSGHLVALALQELGADVRTDGYGAVYETHVYLGSLLYAVMSLWLTYKLLRRFFNRRIAAASLAIVWASSFLIFYQARQYAMAHSLAYLCIIASYYWILAIRDAPRSRRSWMLLGFSVGLLLVTRYQAALYLFFPFALAARELWTRRAPLAAGFACAVAAAIPVALQLLCWKLLYGSWLLYTYQGEGFNWTRPEVYRSLFDANHGLFHWHPIFLFGLVGLVTFILCRKEKLYWLCLLSVAGVIYLNAAWQTWWYGVSFGNRAYEGVTLFAFLGVAQLLLRAERWSPLLQGLLWAPLALLMLWNIAVLEVVIYSWDTGVGLAGAESYADLWAAISKRFFGGGG